MWVKLGDSRWTWVAPEGPARPPIVALPSNPNDVPGRMDDEYLRGDAESQRLIQRDLK